MKYCKKKRHKSRFDAIAFQQIESNNFVPFQEYWCDSCIAWHITIKGISDAFLDNLVKMIQNKNDYRTTFLKYRSRTKSIWRIKTRTSTLLVLYHKRHKRAEILAQIIPENYKLALGK